MRTAPPLIERLMAKFGLPRWPTVYVSLFALVVSFSSICAVFGGGDLPAGSWAAAINDVGVFALTMMMVETGRETSGPEGSWLWALPINIGLMIVFYVICSVPALLLSGFVIGILKAALFGVPV